jgi:hypothetical protein
VGIEDRWRFIRYMEPEGAGVRRARRAP